MVDNEIWRRVVEHTAELSGHEGPQRTPSLDARARPVFPSLIARGEIFAGTPALWPYGCLVPADDLPHPSRLPVDHPQRDEILRRHRDAVEAGEPGYLDPSSGLFVFTAAHHLARGSCCDSGCRHCPYLGSDA